MGRGNYIPAGYDVAGYVGYYIDYNWDDPFFYKDLVVLVKEEMRGMFGGLEESNGWAYNGRVILENSLIRVVVADNENSLAVYVVVPDSEEFPYPELGKKNLAEIPERLEKDTAGELPRQGAFPYRAVDQRHIKGSRISCL